MKKLRLFALALAVYGVLLTPVPAQETPDGGPDASVPVDLYEEGVHRYLVTYMNSQATTAIRSATVVTVTNQSSRSCVVQIEWFRGFVPNTPVCTTTAAVAPGVTHDFCSRTLPGAITSCNSVCAPPLVFAEGKAIVSSSADVGCNLIGVEARLYYTMGAGDMAISAISNPKIVRAEEGNLGD